LSSDLAGRPSEFPTASGILYEEQVSSPRTEALFVLLTLVPLAAFILDFVYSGLTGWSAVLLFACALFLFYSLNYRVLRVRMTAETLTLKFGVFRWTVPLENIAAWSRDRTSLWRIGGAGIHFTWLGGRYRAMFNFLEHPRLVLSLKVRRGPVGDIAFSTRRPELVEELLRRNIETGRRSKPPDELTEPS
jgi:Ca2+/Na+ antiporter